MSIKLTDRFLTSRKAPSAGRASYTDLIVPGLTFRLSAATVSNPEGRRDWLLRYRPRRQKQRAVALGTYPAVSLARARESAGEIVAAAKRGVDLIAAEERDAEARRAAEAKAQPLSEIAIAYLESVKRLRSWRSIESRIRRHIIPKLGNKRIGGITRADVVEFLDGLERKQGLRHQINRCRETLRAIFAFAIERELITVNPIIGVSKLSPAKGAAQTNEEIEFPTWIPQGAQRRIAELSATPLGLDNEYHALLERLAKYPVMKTEVWKKLPSTSKGFEEIIIDWAFSAFTIFPHLPRPHPKTKSAWSKWATHINQRPPLPDPAHLAGLTSILLEEIFKLKPVTDSDWSRLWDGDNRSNQSVGHAVDDQAEVLDAARRIDDDEVMFVRSPNFPELRYELPQVSAMT